MKKIIKKDILFPFFHFFVKHLEHINHGVVEQIELDP